MLIVLAGCTLGPGEEISGRPPYADQIGVEYRIVSDDLYAYGVYDSSNTPTLSYVTLVPRGRIAGREFAFRRSVPKGRVVKILSAWQPSILKSSIYYLVSVEDADLPEGIPVRLQLDRGNQGLDGQLNPSVYRKIGGG